MISDLFSKQGAPHKGSLAAPACQCSVQTSTFLRMGPEPRVNNSSTKQNKTFSSANGQRNFWFARSNLCLSKWKCWRQVYLQCRNVVHGYCWSFESGVATKSVRFKQRIIARATIDVKTSCGVIPALIWKSVLHVVSRTNNAREVSPTLYVCRISAFARQLKTKKIKL